MNAPRSEFAGGLVGGGKAMLIDSPAPV